MKEIRKIIEQYDALDRNKEKLALASVVDVEASAYRRIGARMLVQSSGVWTGGISGGCLEGDALRRSQKAIFDNKVTSVVYDTMEDDQNQVGVGLGCNGRIELLLTPIDIEDPHNEIEILRSITNETEPNVMLKIVLHSNEDLIGQILLVKPGADLNGFAELESEKLFQDIDLVRAKKRAKMFDYENGSVRILIDFIRPETQLIVAGDNYDIYAMLGIANQLGWRSVLLGKAKKLSKLAYQMADKVMDYNKADTIQINEYSVVLLMTHDYKIDLNLLNYFKDKNPAYLGILGPKKRFQKLDGDVDDDLTNYTFIHSPTGLEIGAESPEEIALSICAEVLAKMRDKTGGSLHEKIGSIHERDF